MEFCEYRLKNRVNITEQTLQLGRYQKVYLLIYKVTGSLVFPYKDGVHEDTAEFTVRVYLDDEGNVWSSWTCVDINVLE